MERFENFSPLKCINIRTVHPGRQHVKD